MKAVPIWHKTRLAAQEAGTNTTVATRQARRQPAIRTKNVTDCVDRTYAFEARLLEHAGQYTDSNPIR